VTVYRYDGQVPVPADWAPRPRHVIPFGLPDGQAGLFVTGGSTLDLNCPHCGFAPRPGDDGLRALLELAASRPGATLDINPG
jgi:hypothetical protein